MSNYKTFKNERPQGGRIVEVQRGNDGFYATACYINGCPSWQRGDVSFNEVNPNDEWRYADADDVSPEQQAVASNASMLADLPKIEFSVEDGLLVGKNRETGWCVGIPVNEAYDALLDYSRLVAISSQTPVSNTVPVSNNLRPLPKDFANNAGIAASTPAPNNMSWSQEFETRDLHIKALENLIGRQVETINESDSIIKKHKESINSLHQLIATKNAELDSLRIKNMELTARLNQS